MLVETTHGEGSDDFWLFACLYELGKGLGHDGGEEDAISVLACSEEEVGNGRLSQNRLVIRCARAEAVYRFDEGILENARDGAFSIL